MFPDRLVACSFPARRIFNMPFHEQHIRVASSRRTSADAKGLTTAKVVCPNSCGLSRAPTTTERRSASPQRADSVVMGNSGTVSRGVLR